MSEISKQELEDITKCYLELMVSQQTLLLSTASANGVPDISYAPFVRDDAGVFYVYVSEMACPVNLLNNPQASILFIRPESESHSLFARERRGVAIFAKAFMALLFSHYLPIRIITVLVRASFGHVFINQAATSKPSSLPIHA